MDVRKREKGTGGLWRSEKGYEQKNREASTQRSKSTHHVLKAISILRILPV